jgi:superfamily II DNA or RNA helicase
MELALREHQSWVIDALRQGFKDGHRTQLLYAPTGFGKTEVAISLMKATSDNYKKSAMILDRIVLVDQTSSRLSKYRINHGVYQANHWRFDRTQRIQVCSAQTLEKRQDFPEIDLLIVDECFVAGTKITTLTGHKDIELVRCGDLVYNQHGLGIVESISIKPSDDIYRLEFDDGTITECTGNHPHFTEQGWKATRELEIGSYFFSEQGMRLLWERVETLDQLWGKRKNNIRYAREDLEYANYLLQILLEEITESNEQSSKPFEDESKTKRDQAQTYTAWRERAIVTFAAISPTTRTWARVGSRDSNPNEDGERKRLSDLLQAGLSKSRVDDGDRNRWRIAHNIGKKSTGQKENGSTYFPRLVSVSVVKRESPEPVYNLQVSGHPSYFANGKLVHNCHITRKQISALIQNHPTLKVIGLTATPFTKGLGDLYTNVVCGSTTEDLVNKKWLTPLKVFISKEIDMKGAKKLAGEWSPDEVTKRGMQITGDIVAEWEKKCHEIFGRPRKTIVFCAGVEHGADLVQQFAAKGYNFVSISYKDNDDFKREAIEDFSKPDTEIHGLIATDILTRGFDVPDVMVGVSARPFSKSLSSHIQQIGRVMRPCEGKDFALWLDHSGNYLRFRDDWDEVYSDGVKDLDNKAEKAKKEPTEKTKKESKCPKCSALWPKHSDTCPACGHVRQKAMIGWTAGELIELDNKPRSDKTEKQNFFSELLYIAHERSYNPYWANNKYKEKFGVWPRGLEEQRRVPSLTTMNWVKHKNIAWSKRKNKDNK